MSATVNHSKTLHESRVFSLVRENITLSNGYRFDIDILRHPGASAIVPLTADGQVILIKQYRHALGESIWEIPAGTLNVREDPVECARRELLEETGFNAGVLRKLGMITPVPGYSNERIHMFRATELTPGTQKLDKDEQLDVFAIPLDDALQMVFSGAITDGKTIAGLLMTARQPHTGI